ncbi:P-loop containing nucleoside triphosphate hydrolase protein [Lipomyces kononenkoae]|uniref:P-loop containing nucleoside triphosphate hydrolase protein n=1 Tax=Lipomyces kononenkoae TaxID=34357 RepID=A0ACC3T6H8_LIPKO
MSDSSRAQAGDTRPRRTGKSDKLERGSRKRQLVEVDDDDYDGMASTTSNGDGVRLSWTSDSDDKTTGQNIRKNAASDRTSSKRPGRGKKSRHDESTSVSQYLKSRRQKFDQASTDPRNLALPPNYDGIAELANDAADADDVRPQFKMGPNGEFRDIRLSKSLGVIPAPIAQFLRSYQIDGVAMMHEKFVYQRGMILGDDMGLGKTVQVIAFLTAAFGKSGDSRDRLRMRLMRRLERSYPKVLIICPGTLIRNWERELNTWGWWTTEVFHGTKKYDILSTAKQGRLEIMITTYKTYAIYESEINLIEWDCVVADECHQIKEAEADITKAMAKVNSLCRIGLTGTAIQNSYEDLWSILNWANPGMIGDRRTWIKKISKPLKAGQSHAATWAELRLGRSTAASLVTNLLPRFFLRRTKALIADQLPKKRDMVFFCPLTPLQAEAYANYMQPGDGQRFAKLVSPCICRDKKNPHPKCESCNAAKADKNEHFFRKCVNSLHLANHLAYVIPRNEDSPQDREKAMAVLKQCLPDKWQKYYKRSPLVNYADPELCGKWKALENILKLWKKNGDKVLIFSYSTKLLNMLDTLLTSNGNYSFCRLDGSMSYEDRQKQVDKFNTDPNDFIFLLSTRAGGLGLNIVSANRVVIWDPNWNPTYDLQAQDRAFRLGQYRDVDVYRLVSAGTIEEIVYARQIYKQQQANIGYTASNERRYFDGVMGEAEKKGEIFGSKNMFTFDKENVMLKRIVNKTNVAEALSAELAGLRMGEISLDNTATAATDEAEVKHLLEDDTNKDLDDEVAKKNFLNLTRGTVSKKFERTDPITAILNQVGVKYMHNNSEVIGSSKVEEEISKRALEAGDEGQQVRPFEASGQGEFIFRPPMDVCRRQFNSMAKAFGFKSPTDFALHVERMNQQERRDLLEEFYTTKLASVELR